MSSFEEYANKYKTARMERRNGILQVTRHTEGQVAALGLSAAWRVARGLPRHRVGP
jgi:hypothetical protein